MKPNAPRAAPHGTLAAAKADARRAAIIDRLTDAVLAHGLGAASLRPLAAAAGTSDRMLLYYFADKDAIIAAILTRAAARLAGPLAQLTEAAPRSPAQVEAELMAAIASPELWPSMCLWLEVAALAARGDALMRRVGAEIARGFHAQIAASFAIEDAAARDAAAMRLLRLAEGTIFLRSVGLSDAELGVTSGQSEQNL